MVEQIHIGKRPVSSEEVIDPFETFANLPFYQQINRRMVDCADLHEGERVLDIASGPGNISKLIAEKVGETGSIIAVDFSHKALAAAKRNLSGVKTRIDLIRATAEDIGRLFNDSQLGTFDAAIIGNAIHNFTNKTDVFGGVKRLLRPEAPIVFNTAFFDGAVPSEESRFYRLWVVIASKLAQQIEVPGEKPAKKPEARNPLKPDDYKKLVEENGFKVRSQTFEEVAMSKDDFVAISEDDEFAQGALPRHSLEVAKQALKEGVRKTFEQLGLVTSKRVWMQVVAEKPA